MKNFFRKLKYEICGFCGEIAEPIIIYGAHYYNTAPCRCPEGRETVYGWLRTMDAAWTPPPKTEIELLTEAVHKLTVALRNE